MSVTNHNPPLVRIASRMEYLLQDVSRPIDTGDGFLPNPNPHLRNTRNEVLDYLNVESWVAPSGETVWSRVYDDLDDLSDRLLEDGSRATNELEKAWGIADRCAFTAGNLDAELRGLESAKQFFEDTAGCQKLDSLLGYIQSVLDGVADAWAAERVARQVRERAADVAAASVAGYRSSGSVDVTLCRANRPMLVEADGRRRIVLPWTGSGPGGTCPVCGSTSASVMLSAYIQCPECSAGWTRGSEYFIVITEGRGSRDIEELEA